MEWNLDDNATTEGAMQPIPEVLLNIGKAMRDLDDLVRLLGKILPRAKPWQRQLGSQLSELDRLLQVLRMAVVIEREGAEILAAADTLSAASRKTAATIVGSRCDLDTKLTIRLIADLANRIRDSMRSIDSTQARLLRQAL